MKLFINKKEVFTSCNLDDIMRIAQAYNDVFEQYADYAVCDKNRKIFIREDLIVNTIELTND